MTTRHGEHGIDAADASGVPPPRVGDDGDRAPGSISGARRVAVVQSGVSCSAARAHAQCHRSTFTTARCCSLQSGGRMKAVRPNEAIRNPSMCCECANLATTREHVPFWRSRRDRWETVLTEHERNGMEEFVVVATDRIKQCNSVLRLMGSDPASPGANHAA